MQSVRVAVVNVWVVRVFVGHFGVHMPVNMRFLTFPRKVMDVLVMYIVRMGVLMIKRLMMVLMLVVLFRKYGF